MTTKPRVTVWNEYRHERKNDFIASLYPEGIHGAIASYLRSQGLDVRAATLDEPEHGLSAAVLDETDVLFWWGHMAHQEVDDAVVERIREYVLKGMGLVALHSAHYSKIFIRLMGTSCSLKWRAVGEPERIWIVNPSHPIAAGLGESILIPEAEMYGEFFDVPAPDELVFVSWFAGGNVFRSGLCYRRGLGKVFYFRPGHETHPIYHQPEVQRVLYNAALWAAPGEPPPVAYGQRPEPLHVIHPLKEAQTVH